MEAIPADPSHVMSRAGTMLQLVEFGLADIDDPAMEYLRITRGLYNIAVFGRAVTSARRYPGLASSAQRLDDAA